MKKLDFLPNLRNHYSIRKFTVGTASILIGSLLFLGHNGEAKAAENTIDNTVIETSKDTNTIQQVPENHAVTTEGKTDITQPNGNTETTPIVSGASKEEFVKQAEAKPANTVDTPKEKLATSPEVTQSIPESVKEEAKTKTSVTKSEENNISIDKVVTPREQEIPTITTPTLSIEQKVDRVRTDLATDYDSSKVEAVLATIDTADLTLEQIKVAALKLLLEQSSAEKDLYSPQATLLRTEEEINITPSTRTIEDYTTSDNTIQANHEPTTSKTEVVDKTELETSITKAEKITNLDDSNPIDEQLKVALANAKTINLDQNATPQQVTDASKAINDAIAVKEHQDALDNLNKALNQAALIEQPDYTADSVKQLNDAVDAGNTAFGDDTATVEALNNAAKAINDAIQQLIPDKSQLEKAISDAKAFGTLVNNPTDQLLNYALGEAERIKNDVNASPYDIKIATWNLEDEINNKITSDAVEALRDALKKVATLHEGNYTPNTFEPLKAAIPSGQSIANDPSSADVQTTKAKADEIEKLIQALQKRPDKTELGNALDKAIALGDLNPNDPEDKALQDAVATAQSVEADINATSEEVANATKAITDAITAKERQDAVDELKTELSKVGKLDYQDYTPNSVKPLSEKEILGNAIITIPELKTVEEIKATTQTLKDLQNGLVKKADKTDLNTSVTTAENLGELDPKDTEDKAVQEALDKAKAVQTDDNATQEAVNATKTELDQAIEAKKAQDIKDAQAKQDAVDDLKAELSKVGKVDYKDYTPDSVKPLSDKEILGNAIVTIPELKTTDEIKAVTQSLKDLQNGLVKKADKTDLNTSVTNAENIGTLDPKDVEDKAVQDALDKAKTIQIDDNVAQEAVDTAKTELDQAVEAKKAQDERDALKKAAVEALKTELSKVGKLDYKVFTPNSVKPLSDNEILGNAIVTIPELKTTEEIKAVTQALKDLQTSLVEKADKTELVKALDQAKNIDALDSSDKEDKAVQDAITTGDTIRVNDNATVEEVANAAKAITDAIAVKERQDAVDALKAELSKVGKLDYKDYTPNSVKPLSDNEILGNAIVTIPTLKTIDEIKAVTQTLKDLQNRLVKKADKTGLNTAVTTAGNLGKLEPKDVEDKAVQDALNKAKTVQADDNATQAAVNTAKTELDQAVEAKKTQDERDALKKAAVDELKAELSKVGKLDYKVYTPDSVKPLSDKEILGNAIITIPELKTVEEIKATIQALKDLQNELVKKADKTDLNTSVTNAENLGKLELKDVEDKAVQDALDKAKEVQADDNTTQEAVNTAKTDLDQAIETKKAQDGRDALKQAAVDELKTELSKVGKLDYKFYTPNSVKPLSEKEILGNAIVTIPELKTIEEIKAVTQALKDLQNGLVKKADKTELVKALEQANSLMGLDESDKEDKAVQDAIAVGEIVKENQNVSVEQVTNATKTITDAIIVKERQDAFEELTKAITGAKAINKGDYKSNTVAPLEKAIQAGETMYADATKTVEALKEAVQAIADAQTQLEIKDNKEGLDKVDVVTETLEITPADKDDKTDQEKVDKTYSDLLNESENKTAQDVAEQEKAETEANVNIPESVIVESEPEAEQVVEIEESLSLNVVDANEEGNIVENETTPTAQKNQLPLQTLVGEAQSDLVNALENETVQDKTEQEKAETEVHVNQPETVTVKEENETAVEQVVESEICLDLNVIDEEHIVVENEIETTPQFEQLSPQTTVETAQSELEKMLETKEVEKQKECDVVSSTDKVKEQENVTDTKDTSKTVIKSIEEEDKVVLEEDVDNESDNYTEDNEIQSKETTESKAQIVQTNTKYGAKTQGKQTSKATKTGKTNSKVLPNTGRNVSPFDPQYASLMFAIGGLMMFFRKRKNEEKDYTEK